jgi:protein gp37
MNKTSIEFADFSWNPITGCRNGCDYCWAEKFNNRYFKTDFHVPQFHENRLNEKIPKLPKERSWIAKTISPDKSVIFTVDMGDIFSKGVDESWVKEVFDYAKNHDNATFLFLSKRPGYYISYSDIIPQNVILGTSLDYAHNFKRIEVMQVVKALGHRVFVNIEPLMSRMDEVDFSNIDFVVVGALTGRKYRPDPAWHKSIDHPKIYYKTNYQAYFPELKNITL